MRVLVSVLVLSTPQCQQFDSFNHQINESTVVIEKIKNGKGFNGL